MKIAIVNQHFRVGGVETFLLSLVRQFLQEGHGVEVFLLDPSHPSALLTDLQALGVRIEVFASGRHGASDDRFDVVLVTNPQTLFETIRQLELGRYTADRVVVGAYQTRMFCLDRGPLNRHNRLTRRLFSRLPVANVVFANEACRTEHAQMAPQMAQAAVIPLIVDGDRLPRRPPLNSQNPRRIVSIGRLDHFKTYNLTMPSVIRELRDSGHDVVWDVYGAGVLQHEMRQRVATLHLQDEVRLLGEVAYSQIPRVLSDAFAFVGSGLSMMEAAMCGVPALPAIEYSARPESYGFPHTIPGISFFEPGLDLPRHDLAELLAGLLSSTPAQYESIADAGRAKMSQFLAGSVARRYLEVFGTASIDRPAVGALRYATYCASRMLFGGGATLLRNLERRLR